MTLQLHDDGLSGWNWRKAARSAARFYPNPYYQAGRFAYKHRPAFLRDDSGTYGQILSEIEGTPTYYQFMQETGSTGMEESGELAGRFGTWIKTKALPGLQKVQGALSPIIGMLPGGGVVNAAFDVINRPKTDGMTPAPQPVISPIIPVQPEMQPASYPMPLAPSPAFYPQPAPSGFQLPFGLTPITAGALAIGGLLAYKLLKK